MKAEWNQSAGSTPISMVGRVSVLPTDPLGNPYGDGEARVFVANVYDPGKYKVFVGSSVPYGVTLDDPLDACDGLALTADESIELGKMLLRSGELAGERADEGTEP